MTLDPRHTTDVVQLLLCNGIRLGIGNGATLRRREDVEPGTYRSGGAEGRYYAFMSDVTADADIIDNNIMDGPTVVTLSPGDVFETSGCAEWDKQ